MPFRNIGIVEMLIIMVICATPPVAAIAVAMFMTKQSKSRLKKCPYCAEMIQREAVVCRFCGKDIHSAEN